MTSNINKVMTPVCSTSCQSHDCYSFDFNDRNPVKVICKGTLDLKFETLGRKEFRRLGREMSILCMRTDWL